MATRVKLEAAYRLLLTGIACVRRLSNHIIAIEYVNDAIEITNTIPSHEADMTTRSGLLNGLKHLHNALTESKEDSEEMACCDLNCAFMDALLDFYKCRNKRLESLARTALCHIYLAKHEEKEDIKEMLLYVPYYLFGGLEDVFKNDKALDESTEAAAFFDTDDDKYPSERFQTRETSMDIASTEIRKLAHNPAGMFIEWK